MTDRKIYSNEDHRNELVIRLLEARRCLRNGSLNIAKTNITEALHMYNHYIDRKPPASVQLLYGQILEKCSVVNKALHLFNDIYKVHGKTSALIRIGYICVNTRDLSLLKKHEQNYVKLINCTTISLNQKLQIQIILGYLYSFSRKNTAFVQQLFDYHKDNSVVVREKLRIVDYIHWLYHLHILQLLADYSWNERAPYIYEAQSLAEQYGQLAMLIRIYNLMGIGLLEENVLKAKDFMQKSKDLAKKLGNKQHEMFAISNLLMFYQFLGDTDYAFKLVDQAKKIGQEHHLNFNEINVVKLYYLIEDDKRALKLINELKPLYKKMNLTMARVDALLFQVKIYMRQNDGKKAKRLRPFIEQMCKKHKDELEFFLLQCQFNNLQKQFDETISIAQSCLHHETLSVEYKLEFNMLLLEALTNANEDEAFLKYVNSFEKLVYNKGYFGYLGYVYYFKGIFYLKNHLKIQARVQYVRAKSYFAKVKNLRKQMEIDRYIETIDEQSFILPEKKQGEMMNLLTKNEMMFDNIRLVHSATNIEDVCKNITKVLYENMRFDRSYFYFRIDQNRTKTIYVNELLQSQEVTNDQVNAALNIVMEDKKARRMCSGHYCGFPLLSYENEVIAIVLIENLQKESTVRLEQFLQLIAPKIENTILNELIHIDGLTKLYNRNYFIKKLEEEFEKTANFQSNLSFIMIDIDDFRLVNNQYGHAEGDRVLEKVAKTIQQSVRSSDIVGRYGGEEIIVILPNTNFQTAKNVAERILNNIRKIFIQNNHQITASLGVSNVEKDNPNTILELIDKADLAERYAKQNGKNQVCCYWDIQ